MNEEFLFVTLADSPESYALLQVLHASLQAFGEELSHAPMLVFHPAGQTPHPGLSPEAIELQTLNIPSAIQGYLFSAKVTAMAQAEKLSGSYNRTLIWIDPACLILKPPRLYRLDGRAEAALRPVHIRNIGSLADESLDGYWKEIYAACDLDESDAFTESFVDGQRLRAYYNSHAFSINASLGLMSLWLDTFTSLVDDRGFQAAYCQDERHRIFLFQAVLSALITRNILPDRIRLLPPEYNYPYNLQDSVPHEKRAASMDALVSLTYEGRQMHPAGITDIRIPEPYKSFLERSFTQHTR
jgi:hypothetical protein